MNGWQLKVALRDAHVWNNFLVDCMRVEVKVCKGVGIVWAVDGVIDVFAEAHSRRYRAHRRHSGNLGQAHARRCEGDSGWFNLSRRYIQSWCRRFWSTPCCFFVRGVLHCCCMHGDVLRRRVYRGCQQLPCSWRRCSRPLLGAIATIRPFARSCHRHLRLVVVVLRRLDFVPVSRPSESAASEEQAYLGSRHFCSGPEGDSHRFLNTSIVHFLRCR
mmetsp:Transcript_34978/g.51218  ORF Transcript_34978/g.51218 Transcript_34978/m.51218 type:complete len:216 (-) Transcript_34978:37-684(-)